MKTAETSKPKVTYITGCLGFIGGYITRACLNRGWHVYGVDKLTYAANDKLLDEFSAYPNFRFENIDLNDLTRIYDCDYVINLAAETHVDNSIVSSSEFIRSNINGVHNLLGLIQTKSRFTMPMLVHFSTDEVYGDVVTGSHRETDIMRPSNPYSATKASADMLILAWHRTHGIPYLILRPTNNYGIGQYVEKFIPKSCKYLELGRRVPLHDQGLPVRTWLHAQDTANAMLFLLDLNIRNDIYNISGNYQDTNLNVFKKILRVKGLDPEGFRDHVDFFARPGQDVRYSIDDSKLRSLGWCNTMDFDQELEIIVRSQEGTFRW